MSSTRFFFHAAFLGTYYRGWQRQSNAGSVQEVVERVFSEILKEPISVMGCGRTDAQVHASQFYFHADLSQPLHADFLFRLNKVLPPDIAVYEIIPVADNQHARFDAIQRQYDYFMHTYKDPFLNPVSTLLEPRPWQVDKMKQAVTLLTRYDDYRAFCKSPNIYQHTRCRITAANLWMNATGDRLRFQISADRFLGRMVRLLVGKLIGIGSGTLSVNEFESYFIEKNTPARWDPAYPQGLFLSNVNYPYLKQPARTDFDTVHHTASWIPL